MIKVLSTNAINPYFKYDIPNTSSSGYIKSDSFPAYKNFAISGNYTHKVTVIDSANAFCPVKDTTYSIIGIKFLPTNPELSASKSIFCKNQKEEINRF
jgi:hypothetical protein